MIKNVEHWNSICLNNIIMLLIYLIIILYKTKKPWFQYSQDFYVFITFILFFCYIYVAFWEFCQKSPVPVAINFMYIPAYLNNHRNLLNHKFTYANYYCFIIFSIFSFDRPVIFAICSIDNWICTSWTYITIRSPWERIISRLTYSTI